MTAHELARKLLSGKDCLVSIVKSGVHEEVIGAGWQVERVFGEGNPTREEEFTCGYPKEVETVVLTTVRTIE